MRLVIATPLYPPEIGGPATYTKLLEEGLPARGIEVEVVKFADVRHLPRFIRHFAYYRRVLAAARRSDAVLALDPVSVGLPAMKAAKRTGKPFFVKIVGDYAWEQGRQRFGITAPLDEFVRTKSVPPFVWLLRRIQTRVARSATRVIVPSHYLKGIIKEWGIPEAKVEVVYNAVEATTIGQMPDAASGMKPFVVTVGRLVPWKRFDKVIDAVAANPNYSLVIIGDGPLRQTLQAHVKEKLGSRGLMTGELSHDDTLAVMREAEALVLNSTYEGLSHVLIEAQACGLPAIVTEAGGNPEVVTNGKSGLVIPVDDPNALVNALHDYANVDRSHMRREAIENAKRFSLEVMLSHTASLMQNI